MSRLFTSESVTEGHPDKVADQISDSVLDEALSLDPASHCAIETLVANGVVLVAGEMTTNAYVDVPEVARTVIARVGYDSPEAGLDASACGVLTSIDSQSPDIAQGVLTSWESRHGIAVDAFDRQGAGDQGLMFGYACAETPTLMPMPIFLAHRLSERLAEVRHDGTFTYLRPDGKTQATVEYDDARLPVKLTTAVISTQHSEDVTLEQIEADVISQVIRPVLDNVGIDYSDARMLINPSGRFVAGGPAADTGLTGRKIIVDTYGGMAHHGGGAFSGKDASKVDRSASYALRWVAKNVVAAGLAKRCEIQAAYAIGCARPVSLNVDTFGTGSVPDNRLVEAVAKVADLRVAAIIERLGLRQPIYAKTTNYGHFGREAFTWERTDIVGELQNAL